MVWFWIPIIGILLGWLLWHGEQPEVREAKARARQRKRGKKPSKKRAKPRGTLTIIVEGIRTGDQELRDLEESVLIDDFEEELFEEGEDDAEI